MRQHRYAPRERDACLAAGNSPYAIPIGRALVLLFALVLSLFGGISSGAARQADSGFSPASGPAQVIAQGVVALPEGDAVWRTVRTRALLPQDAPFEERPLGFVLASSGPLLLADQETGDQVRLGTGEAAIVPAGTIQKRSSLGTQPVSYLSIELVGIDAAPPPADATVLQPGQPFAAPTGLHDLDLLSASLVAGEAFTIPDSGGKNVVLITDGAADVGRPGGDAVVLLAGEAASFSGELQVSGASDRVGEEQDVSFVVAMIGPEVPPPAGIAETSASPTATAETPAPPTEISETPAQPTATSAAAGKQAAAGQGAITVQVYSCPPGMTAETVAAAACAPTVEDFDIIISGEPLQAPLTLVTRWRRELLHLERAAVWRLSDRGGRPTDGRHDLRPLGQGHQRRPGNWLSGHARPGQPGAGGAHLQLQSGLIWSGRNHLHGHVLPAHLALDLVGEAAEPGILLGELGQALVGRLILGQGHKDHLLRLSVGVADQLDELPGDLGPNGL